MSDTLARFDAIADRLYDAQPSTPAPTPPEPPPTPAKTEDDVADAFYGSRESLASTYGPSLTDSMNALRDRTGMSEDQFTTAIGEAAEVFHDARITPEHAARLHSQLTHHLTTPADDATIEAWSADARRELRDRYGAEEADRRLATAREFVVNRPALAQLLNASGMGSHPDVVLALAENVGQLRVAPRTGTKA